MSSINGAQTVGDSRISDLGNRHTGHRVEHIEGGRCLDPCTTDVRRCSQIWRVQHISLIV